MDSQPVPTLDTTDPGQLDPCSSISPLDPVPSNNSNSNSNNNNNEPINNNNTTIQPVDLDACQASSVGVALFKLFNGSAVHSLNFGRINADSDDEDDEDDVDDEDDIGIHDDASFNSMINASRMASSTDRLMFFDSGAPRSNNTTTNNNSIEHDPSLDQVAPTKISPSSSSNSIPFITVSNATSHDFPDTNMSKLAQSVQSFVLSNHSARRSSRASIKTAKSIKSLKSVSNLNPIPDDVEDSKLRAGHIADTLKSLGVNDDDVLIADYPCWLLRHVLLEGRLYVTNNDVCFTAFLPATQNDTLFSGNLNKAAKHSSRVNRHWFVLRPDQLAYYSSAKDLYFPTGVIDLRYAFSAELVTDDESNGDKFLSKSFQLVTEHRTYHFIADSPVSAQQWVKSLQRAIFLSHNEGDQVKIKIPVENIVDLEESQLPEFGVALKLRAIDSEDTFSIDEYVLAFIHPKQTSEVPIETIRRVMDQKGIKDINPEIGADRIFEELAESRRVLGRITDSTNIPSSPTTAGGFGVLSTPPDFATPKSPSISQPTAEVVHSVANVGRRFTRKVKSLVDPSRSRSPSVSRSRSRSGSPRRSFSQSSGNRARSTSRPTSSLANYRAVLADSEEASNELMASQDSFLNVVHDDYSESIDIANNYNPNTKPAHSSNTLLPGFSFRRSHSSSSGADLPTEKKKSVRDTVVSKVSDMFTSSIKHFLPPDSDEFVDSEDSDKYQVSDEERVEANTRFRNHFSFGDEEEQLVATYYAHIQKPIPIYGKIYVSTNFVCFRSLLIGTKTKMVLPIKDVENVSSEHGFKFGYSGLVFIIHGHEDVFFEFSSRNARDDCESVVKRRLEILKMQASITLAEESNNHNYTADEKLRMARLRTYESKMRSMGGIFSVSENPPIVPTIETKKNLSEVEKPLKTMHITMVAIGSRGDVQPYIALSKGLQKEGHTCRIATHSEFKPWVEKYGIEFREIAGDPGELMKIMIEHGMFSVSFLRDAASKFRGWIDELLHTAWEACQDTDVIIESPSAMAGIHIAEALKIPYFRAFTMPWTRTRTYPHAFMVPEQKMGGSYNHLTYVLFDNVFWKGISGQVNRWRVNELGLEKTNLDLMQQSKVPFMYNVSPHVLVPPVDYPDWLKVTGYWFLDEGGKDAYEPPADLVNFINTARANNKKLVYIGFGSIVVSNPKELTQCVVESVLKAGVYCILSKGWSDRFDDNSKSKVEVPLPPEIFQISSAPHDWLFPLMDAAVHHGGSGTTGASLRSGLPTVIKPFFGDQFFYAGRVEDLGVGVFLKKLSVSTFSKAIIEVTTSEKVISKAKLLGKKIRSEHGVQTAIAFMYWQLDHAMVIVKEREERRQKGIKENFEDEDDLLVDNSETVGSLNDLSSGLVSEKIAGEKALSKNYPKRNKDGHGGAEGSGDKVVQGLAPEPVSTESIVTGLLSVGAIGSAAQPVAQANAITGNPNQGQQQGLQDTHGIDKRTKSMPDVDINVGQAVEHEEHRRATIHSSNPPAPPSPSSHAPSSATSGPSIPGAKSLKKILNSPLSSSSNSSSSSSLFHHFHSHCSSSNKVDHAVENTGDTTLERPTNDNSADHATDGNEEKKGSSILEIVKNKTGGLLSRGLPSGLTSNSSRDKSPLREAGNRASYPQRQQQEVLPQFQNMRQSLQTYQQQPASSGSSTKGSVRGVQGVNASLHRRRAVLNSGNSSGDDSQKTDESWMIVDNEEDDDLSG